MNDVDQVGGKLRNAITAAKAKGWNVVRSYVRGPSNAGNSCCALGCVVIDIPGGVPLYGTIAGRLGIAFNDMIGIGRGFDGSPYDSETSLPNWHALGERLYAELQEGTL